MSSPARHFIFSTSIHPYKKFQIGLTIPVYRRCGSQGWAGEEASRDFFWNANLQKDEVNPEWGNMHIYPSGKAKQSWHHPDEGCL